jgi:hypothetical protein
VPNWRLSGVYRLKTQRSTVWRSTVRRSTERSTAYGPPLSRSATIKRSTERSTANGPPLSWSATVKRSTERSTVSAPPLAVHRQRSTVRLAPNLAPPASRVQLEPDASFPYRAYPLYGKAIIHWPTAGVISSPVLVTGAMIYAAKGRSGQLPRGECRGWR